MKRVRFSDDARNGYGDATLFPNKYTIRHRNEDGMKHFGTSPFPYENDVK